MCSYQIHKFEMSNGKKFQAWIALYIALLQWKSEVSVHSRTTFVLLYKEGLKRMQTVPDQELPNIVNKVSA